MLIFLVLNDRYNWFYASNMTLAFDHTLRLSGMQRYALVFHSHVGIESLLRLNLLFISHNNHSGFLDTTMHTYTGGLSSLMSEFLSSGSVC